MSSIIIAGDTSGTVTIAAPSTAGTTTLTLPSTSGTIVTTNGGYVPTSQLASGTASSSTYLRGDQSWAAISSGGMTLLGTLTTTSGTTQTLSGLTLTSYKQLNITYNNVGYTSGAVGEFRIAGVAITQPSYLSNTTAVYGGMSIDLSTGATFGCVEAGYINAGTSNSLVFAGQAGPLAGNLSTINTSTTSIAFTFSGGQTFASGTIKVYGVA